MDTETVLAYLQNNPHFFEEHAEQLSALFVSGSHDGKTLSLAERYMLNLRQKINTLEYTYNQLIKAGKTNDEILSLLHNTALLLLRLSRDQVSPEILLDTLQKHLIHDYQIDQVVFRFWGINDTINSLLANSLPTILPMGKDTETAEIQLEHLSPNQIIYCGSAHLYSNPHPSLQAEVHSWLSASPPAKGGSLLLLPLHSPSHIGGGLLGLVSYNPDFFRTDNDLLYVRRLSEWISCLISPWLKPK